MDEELYIILFILFITGFIINLIPCDISTKFILIVILVSICLARAAGL